VLRPPAGVTHVVLDTPGGLRGFDLARVVAFADVVLLPVCNSIFDRESAGECFTEMMTLPRVASGRCKVAAVGMRLDARTKGAEVLASWARDLKLPFIGVIREAQAYVRCVEQGLTVFDLADAQAQIDVAQWQPIVAWLEPVLRKVWRPELRGNPSVVRRTTSGIDLPLADDDQGRVMAIAEGDDLVAEPHREAALARADARPAAERARASGGEAPRPAPLRLGGLLSWLTTPRFLHRNS
jgi:hypothetical protein